jgi:hypothetical protein
MSKTWYHNQNLKPQGPYSLPEMRDKIHRGEIGPEDLICNDTEGHWRPAREFREFEPGLYPAAQGLQPEGAALEEKIWILLSPAPERGGSMQEGPFSTKELMEQIERGHLSLYRYVWKSGLSGWCMIKDRTEFALVNTSERLAITREESEF